MPDAIVSAVVDGVTWWHREGTNDLGIIVQNVEENACRLPDRMDGQIVIDIGAHIGAVAVSCAIRGATVFAVEPSPSSGAVLMLNSHDRPAITVVPVGIGEPGWGTLYCDEYNRGMSSLTREMGGPVEETVSLIPFRRVLHLAGGRCDFLKVDCEGAEVAVVRDIIDADLWPYIARMFIEFHDANEAELLRLLLPHYDATEIGGHHFLFARR